MTSWPEAMGWGFWNLKKAVTWDLNSELESQDLGLDEASRFSELAEARSVVCGGSAVRGEVRWKSQHRKKLCLSLPMLKNLRLKNVIKFSYLNQRKRVVGVLSIFGFLYAYLCEYLDRIFEPIYITTVLFVYLKFVMIKILQWKS